MQVLNQHAAQSAMDPLKNENPSSRDSADPFAYWRSAPLADLVSHLAAEHIRWTGADLPHMEELIRKASGEVQPANPALAPIASGLSRLRETLTKHFRGEEQVLFPTAVALERAVASHSPIGRPSFGSVRNPVSLLTREHEEEGRLMKNLRGVCEQHNLSGSASEELRQLNDALRQLQDALSQHRQVENEVLFPRMVELERTAREFKQ